MPKKSMPLVSIVLVNWNGEELLKEHFQTVVGIEYKNKEIILVDNGSKDNSVRFIKKNYPTVKIIKNDVNLGTAEGSNVAIPYCKGKYLFWISNDMDFDPKILSHLVSVAEEDKTVGICTAKMRRLVDGKKTNILDSVGSSIDIFGFPSAVGIEEEDNGQYDEIRDVFFSFGGALFIRTGLVRDGTVYDESFLTLTDDIDLCWRVRLLGYKVKVAPDALLYHRVSATLSKSHNRAEKRFISERNTIRMLLKNYSLMSLSFILPLFIILMALESCFFLIIGKFQLSKSNLRALIWNIKRISETYYFRQKVQNSRVVPDNDIFKMMDKKSEKLHLFFDFVRNSNATRWKSYF